MSLISCIADFKENFTKNIPYYRLLLKQVGDAQKCSSQKGSWIGEHAAMSSSCEDNILSKICEGYQFVICFDGRLLNTENLMNKLSSLGYCFTFRNDAELALNSYIHFGEKALLELDGSFSFVIYDTMRRQIFAASDSFSSSPIFYTNLSGLYIFASQVRGIFSHPDIIPRISQRGLSDLLSFSRGIRGAVFENVHMLPPAHFLKIKDGEFIVKKYSRLPSKASETHIPPEEQLLSRLAANVQNNFSENSAVLNSGNVEDEILCFVAAENYAKNLSRISEYSLVDAGISKKFSPARTQIFFDEASLYDSLKRCVSICGFPTISNADFLLPLMFDRIPKSITKVFTALPDMAIDTSPMRKFISHNNAFHPAVDETLELSDSSGFIPINSSHILAEDSEVELISPFLSCDIFDLFASLKTDTPEFFSNCISHLCAGNSHVLPKSYTLPLTRKLKRILLDIIADESAPILAFFDKVSLLKLCERGFDIPNGSLSEIEVISYIIKLNIWFLTYKPVIL